MNKPSYRLTSYHTTVLRNWNPQSEHRCQNSVVTLNLCEWQYVQNVRKRLHTLSSRPSVVGGKPRKGISQTSRHSLWPVPFCTCLQSIITGSRVESMDLSCHFALFISLLICLMITHKHTPLMSLFTVWPIISHWCSGRDKHLILFLTLYLPSGNPMTPAT